MFGATGHSERSRLAFGVCPNIRRLIGYRVDLYEYQARDIFESHGVPVLAGIVADTPEEVEAAARQLGGVVVVKAQVKTGGRGKAGGVKVAKTPEEA